VYYQNPVRHIM